MKNDELNEYVTGITAFFFISCIVLLFSIVFFRIKRVPVWMQNDLGFCVLELSAGILARFIYKFFCMFRGKKGNVPYVLKETEVTCTLLFACASLSVFFAVENDLGTAGCFLAIGLSKFFWIDSAKINLKEIRLTFERVPRLYLCQMWIILIYTMMVCFFDHFRCLYSAFIVGIILGVILSGLWIVRRKPMC